VTIPVKGIVWLGVRTDRVRDMKALFADVFGFEVRTDDGDFVVLRAPSGDVVELFGPSDREHRHFSTGPVVEFLVDDVEGARRELEERGVEVLSEIESGGGTSWFHFRGPDGNVYGMTSG
jgi:predicted enzyme related to lactoylglutathione lyase